MHGASLPPRTDRFASTIPPSRGSCIEAEQRYERRDGCRTCVHPLAVMINRVLRDLSMQWAGGGKDGWIVLSAVSSAVDVAVTSESEGRCANARAHARMLKPVHSSSSASISPSLLSYLCHHS